MDKICAIISGGEFSPFADIEEAEFIIACDKGYEYAKKQAIRPDLIIGDFDSYNGALTEDTPILTLPCEKDETDTQAAINYAIKHGFSKILLFCALGGRLDHLLGNIQASSYAAKSGLTVKIQGENDEIYVFSNSSITIPKRENFSVSAISLTDKCENVTITGGKYTLKNAVLTNTSTLGISNEWIDDINVSIKDGVLAVVMSRIE